MIAVLDIDADGTIRCVHNEALPLAELGRMEVSRASTVEFNPEAQEWEVRLASEPDKVAFSHASRSACIAWEVATLNGRLLAA